MRQRRNTPEKEPYTLHVKKDNFHRHQQPRQSNNVYAKPPIHAYNGNPAIEQV